MMMALCRKGSNNMGKPSWLFWAILFVHCGTSFAQDQYDLAGLVARDIKAAYELRLSAEQVQEKLRKAITAGVSVTDSKVLVHEILQWYHYSDDSVISMAEKQKVELKRIAELRLTEKDPELLALYFFLEICFRACLKENVDELWLWLEQSSRETQNQVAINAMYYPWKPLPSSVSKMSGLYKSLDKVGRSELVNALVTGLSIETCDTTTVLRMARLLLEHEDTEKSHVVRLLVAIELRDFQREAQKAGSK